LKANVDAAMPVVVFIKFVKFITLEQTLHFTVVFLFANSEFFNYFVILILLGLRAPKYNCVEKVVQQNRTQLWQKVLSVIN